MSCDIMNISRVSRKDVVFCHIKAGELMTSDAINKGITWLRASNFGVGTFVAQSSLQSPRTFPRESSRERKAMVISLIRYFRKCDH